MASDGKGYRVPHEPITGLRCIRIYIPDDDMYLYALSGSLLHLTNWTAWERDATRLGKRAAAEWWAAWEYTQANGWLDCGDGQPPVEEDDMTVVNNYVNCGSGCGCGDQAPTWQPPNGNPITITLPTTGDDFPNPPPPANENEPPPPYFPDDPTWEDETAWNEARCRIANWAWRQVDAFFYNMEQADNRAVQLGTIIAIFIGLAPAAIMARIGTAALLEIVAAIGEVTAITAGWSGFFSVLVNYWRSHQEEIVCRAAAAESAQQLSTDHLAAILDDLIAEWEELPGWTQAIVDAAVSATSFFFSPGLMSLFFNFQPPPYFVPDIDCELCGSTAYHYRLLDKDNGIISTFSANTGQVYNASTTPGSSGGFLVLIRFLNEALEHKNATGQLTLATGHTAPTNTNHPWTVLCTPGEGQTPIVLLPLGSTITLPFTIDDYFEFKIHSLTDFTASFRIDSISA